MEMLTGQEVFNQVVRANWLELHIGNKIFIPKTMTFSQWENKNFNQVLHIEWEEGLDENLESFSIVFSEEEFNESKFNPQTGEITLPDPDGEEEDIALVLLCSFPIFCSLFSDPKTK